VFYSSPDTSDSVFGDLREWERDELIQKWGRAFARDIIEQRVVVVDAETTVEEACDKLLTEGIDCLVVVDNKTLSPATEKNGHWTGLFDFSDVNAFLTLAATRHTLAPEVIKANERLDRIVEAAKAGRVPVKLVCYFSDKNPYVVLPHDASVISLLEVFARGTHRAFIRNTTPPVPGSHNAHLLGMVSDKRLLSWFAKYAKDSSLSLSFTSPFDRILAKPLFELAFPLLNIHTAVVAASYSASVLDAMRLMSEEGVSSVAVVDEELGILIGAISVTDIGKVVVPSQTNQIFGTPLKQFVASIKLPDGSTDGVDKYPVYSVSPSSSLVYTIEKLLATNAHRLFVTDDPDPVLSPSSPGNLTGIISIVDILSLFAHLAKIPDVDPTRMQRHRRASSASSSSHSSFSDQTHFLHRSRSNSRTGVHRSPSFGVMPMAASPSAGAVTFGEANSPVGVHSKNPAILPPVPDISSALGGSVGFGVVGRRGSSSASLRARKRDSVQ